MILQTGDATLVAVERPDEFARRGVPDFDGAIAGGGNDVLVVEVDDVDSRAVPNLKVVVVIR